MSADADAQEWFRRDLGVRAQREIRGSALATHGLIDHDRVDGLWPAHRGGLNWIRQLGRRAIARPRTNAESSVRLRSRTPKVAEHPAPAPIRGAMAHVAERTSIDAYWGARTVSASKFPTQEESERQLT